MYRRWSFLHRLNRLLPPVSVGWGKVIVSVCWFVHRGVGTLNLARTGWVHQGTYPPAKVPTPWLDQDGGTPRYLSPPRYLPPWPGPDGGYPKVPTPPPSQVHTGRGYPRYLPLGQSNYPWPGQDGGGVPQGTYPSLAKVPTPSPPARSGWGGGRYLWSRTCYTAGGMPLAFMQEDFLVFENVWVTISPCAHCHSAHIYYLLAICR